MPKIFLFGNDARQALMRGVDKVATAVGATLGPVGRCVIIEEPQDRSPTVTKDGVTVSRVCYLEDPLENIGARMIRDVASKTVDICGDGTTTATVLAQAIFKEGLDALGKGSNPTRIKAGIDLAAKTVCDEIRLRSKPVNPQALLQIGTIAANNDPEIGLLISDAMARAGSDGVLAIADAIGFDTYLESVDGMQLGRGWVDPLFVTDRAKDECVLENVYILLWEKKLSTISPAIELLKQVVAKNGSLLVIAEDIDGDALENLKVNKERGLLKSCAIRIPGHPLHRAGTLADISAMTGATPITSALDIGIKEVTLAHLGQASKVIVGKESTLIIDGAGAPEDVKKRAAELRSLVAHANGNEKDLLQQRLAALTGGMVIIRVGGFTETAAAEKKYRVEDAMHACRAAVEEGIIPGGGTALAREAAFLDMLNVSGDEKVGVGIVARAITKPLCLIAINAGHDDLVVLNNVLINEAYDYGYNALTDKYEDLMQAGVIDPAKVVITALRNAASIAGIMLTTECLVSEIRPTKVNE